MSYSYCIHASFFLPPSSIFDYSLHSIPSLEISTLNVLSSAPTVQPRIHLISDTFHIIHPIFVSHSCPWLELNILLPPFSVLICLAICVRVDIRMSILSVCHRLSRLPLGLRFFLVDLFLFLELCI